MRPFVSTNPLNMFDYMKPTQRYFNPNMAEQISEEISNLIESLKINNNVVVISSILSGGDLQKRKAEVPYKKNNAKIMILRLCLI